ncbi:Retrovirus-related Pol polyprotein from transposon RE1 [Vitis vinifera]|uniref:Retrovirus-related Pol polyprotein from transposon RE1 n=1 Tax=Vitis vinifera TaxID=29760 RepID=A0A438H157_VITVI|nr:Retrovirus-related Pol polyprotein from transposon RE1 [Vitis vinifera]
MFITMDVVFHEDSMYFSSESEFQGEYDKEIQTLGYDYHISKKDEFEPSKQFGSEYAFIEIPNQSSSVEGVLNLEPDPFIKRLPHCHNRECPPGKKSVGCHWIYIVKYKADGNIERFKARLVAKGYTQTYGIDYTNIFVPIAKINTVRVLLSLAANLDWPLQQFDVKNVFLHSELSEEVYMDRPPGCMVSEKQCQKMCKLNKSLYGLKQSLRAWFGRFTKSMRTFGYRQITGNDPEERKTLQNYLSREFKMKDLVMRILRYLKNAPGKGILFAKNVDHQSIEVYTDVDWADTVDDRRSTSGYFTFVGGYLSRQPIRLFCDNKDACDITHNPVQHDRTKHVEVDRLFIKEKLNDKIVELSNIRSEDQLANILTKAVSSQVFSEFLDKLGMCDIYAPT